MHKYIITYSVLKTFHFHFDIFASTDWTQRGKKSHEDKHANFDVKCLWKHLEQLSQLSVMSYVMKSTCTLWGGSRWKYVISPASGPTRARRCWIFFLSSNSLHNSKQMFIDVYVFPYSGSLDCLSKTVRTRTHSVVRRSTQTAVCFTT